MARHQITAAENIYAGAVNYPPYHANKGTTSRGTQVDLPYWHNFGAALAADIDHIMDAATSTELPNTETVTYTALADDGSSPFDNADTPEITTIIPKLGGSAVTVWPLGTPRALVVTTTHGSSVVAMTVVVTGYDVYRVLMVESIAVTATGTSQTDNGLKAFAYISTIAITAAADAEANTCNLGIGDVLGLPFHVDNPGRVFGNNDGAPHASDVTVEADDTTATATTGDVRGTWNPGVALNAAKEFSVMMFPTGRDTKDNAFGIAQYGG